MYLKPVEMQLKQLFLVSLFRIGLIIGLVEALIMVALRYTTGLTRIEEDGLDALLLILLSSPLLWFMILRPLVGVISQQQKTTTDQIRLNAELRVAVDAHALVSITDAKGRIIYANAKFCELSGYSQDELLGQDHRLVNSGYHDKAYIRSLWETITQGRIWQGELCNRNKSGQLYWVDSTITPLLDETGSPYQYISIRRDITAQKLADEQLAIFKQAVEASSEMILITNAEGCIQYANPAFYQITGWNEATLLGRRSEVLDSPNTDKQTLASMQAALQHGESWSGKLLNRRKGIAPLSIAGQTTPPDPLEYWAKVYITPIISKNGNLSGYVQMQGDITAHVVRETLEQRNQEDAKARLAIANTLHQPVPLKERCLSALSLLYEIQSLQLQQKGGIFLREESEERLELFVLKGDFSDEFIEKEQSIALGSCLCGRAAVSVELLVSDDCFCDPRHEHKFTNMQAHGHYIVPLVVSGNTLVCYFFIPIPTPSTTMAA